MISANNVASLIGATVIDSDGDKVGRVGQIFVDPASGLPNWATVKTGLFGTSETFIPLDAAEHIDGELRLPYTKHFVKDAPRVDAGAALETSQEDSLYAYYHGGEPAHPTGSSRIGKHVAPAEQPAGTPTTEDQ